MATDIVPPPPTPPPDRRKMALSFFFAGLLPIVAFTLIEDQYGTIAGIIAAMVFGVGEIIWEWATVRKVSAITWGGNALILAMGAVSLISNEGIWFKLQPALIEGGMAVALWGSVLIGRPLLVLLAKKQNPELPSVVRNWLNGLTFRLGIFFALHAGIAVWAALKWTTAQWALLKGVGLTLTMIIYLLIEVMIMRQRNKRTRTQDQRPPL